MTAKEILKALKNGRELVVIAQNEYCDSAIHNIPGTQKNGCVMRENLGK